MQTIMPNGISSTRVLRMYQRFLTMRGRSQQWLHCKPKRICLIFNLLLDKHWQNREKRCFDGDAALERRATGLRRRECCQRLQRSSLETVINRGYGLASLRALKACSQADTGYRHQQHTLAQWCGRSCDLCHGAFCTYQIVSPAWCSHRHNTASFWRRGQCTCHLGLQPSNSLQRHSAFEPAHVYCRVRPS